MAASSSSDDESWERKQEEVALSQAVSDASAEELSELDLETNPPKVWWAQLLMMHADQAGYSKVPLNRNLNIISGCTGSFAEAAVLKD